MAIIRKITLNLPVRDGRSVSYQIKSEHTINEKKFFLVCIVEDISYTSLNGFKSYKILASTDKDAGPDNAVLWKEITGIGVEVEYDLSTNNKSHAKQSITEFGFESNSNSDRPHISSPPEEAS